MTRAGPPLKVGPPQPKACTRESSSTISIVVTNIFNLFQRSKNSEHRQVPGRWVPEVVAIVMGTIYLLHALLCFFIGAGVCLQPPRGDLVTVWGRWAGRDGGERTQQEAFADRTGASLRGRSVGRMAGQLQTGRQLGVESSRARARLNWVSQGQRCGRCRVRRRAGEPSG